jgi:hypothetical protein
MKKKKSDPPHDFEVEDADVAFGKLEDATRRLLAVKKPETKSVKTKPRKKS